VLNLFRNHAQRQYFGFESACSAFAPYTVTAGNSGISPIHRPSVSRSSLIVDCI
jgi:hypothetical protein